MYQVPENVLKILFDLSYEYVDLVGFKLADEEEEAVNITATILGLDCVFCDE